MLKVWVLECFRAWRGSLSISQRGVDPVHQRASHAARGLRIVVPVSKF